MTHLHLRFLTNRYFLTTGQGQGGVGLCLSTTQGAVPDLGAGQHVSQSTPRSESLHGPPQACQPVPRATQGAAVPTGQAVSASRRSGPGSWQSKHVHTVHTVHTAAWAKLPPLGIQGGQDSTVCSQGGPSQLPAPR